MEELQEECMPVITLEERTPLLDSSDMGPTDWVDIAAKVRGVG